MTEQFVRVITTRIPRGGNSGGTMDGPTERWTFELTLDLDGIRAFMAGQVANNSTMKSQEMGGLVKCRRIQP